MKMKQYKVTKVTNNEFDTNYILTNINDSNDIEDIDADLNIKLNDIIETNEDFTSFKVVK